MYQTFNLLAYQGHVTGGHRSIINKIRRRLRISFEIKRSRSSVN